MAIPEHMAGHLDVPIAGMTCPFFKHTVTLGVMRGFPFSLFLPMLIGSTPAPLLIVDAPGEPEDPALLTD